MLRPLQAAAVSAGLEVKVGGWVIQPTCTSATLSHTCSSLSTVALVGTVACGSSAWVNSAFTLPAEHQRGAVHESVAALYRRRFPWITRQFLPHLSLPLEEFRENTRTKKCVRKLHRHLPLNVHIAPKLASLSWGLLSLLKEVTIKSYLPWGSYYSPAARIVLWYEA